MQLLQALSPQFLPQFLQFMHWMDSAGASFVLLHEVVGHARYGSTSNTAVMVPLLKSEMGALPQFPLLSTSSSSSSDTSRRVSSYASFYNLIKVVRNIKFPDDYCYLYLLVCYITFSFYASSSDYISKFQIKQGAQGPHWSLQHT